MGVDVQVYDATPAYRFSVSYWPTRAKPLWIWLCHPRIEKELTGTTDVTRDYFIIVDYEWEFK